MAAVDDAPAPGARAHGVESRREDLGVATGPRRTPTRKSIRTDRSVPPSMRISVSACRGIASRARRASRRRGGSRAGPRPSPRAPSAASISWDRLARKSSLSRLLRWSSSIRRALRSTMADCSARRRAFRRLRREGVHARSRAPQGRRAGDRRRGSARPSAIARSDSRRRKRARARVPTPAGRKLVESGHLQEHDSSGGRPGPRTSGGKTVGRGPGRAQRHVPRPSAAATEGSCCPRRSPMRRSRRHAGERARGLLDD